MRKRLALTLLLAASVALCQQLPTAPANPAPSGSAPASAKDTLAINDQLVISAHNVDGINDSTFRIDPDGTVTLPLVGKVRAEGLTVEQFEKDLTTQFEAYVRSPQVSVKRLAKPADTVVVAGAFKTPGVYPLSDQRSLLQVIASVGGLQPNVRTVRITRQMTANRAPLPSGTEDGSGVSTATIDLSRLVADTDLRDKLVIEPDDVLFASSTGPAFLTGEVNKPGAFDVGEGNSLGVMELISMAGGLGKDAAPEKAVVLRPILNGTRRAEIPLNIKNIEDGEATDFRVMPNDMVVVPRSGGKVRAVAKVLMFVAPALMGTLIYTAIR